MLRDELDELHCITPIANVASIVSAGILSHDLAEGLSHISVALQEVQDRRVDVVVPGGLRLHQYANLYFDARNPMMFLRKHRHLELCVLRVSPEVLDEAGVVVYDGNAASEYSRPAAAPAGLSIVCKEMTFAEWWTDGDQYVYYDKKRRKCAEVLVPNRVAPDYIRGAFVSCPAAAGDLQRVAPSLPCTVKSGLFFQ